MIINWYGEGCFKIQTGGVSILTDPFDSSIGLTPPRFKADITIKTLTQYPIDYKEAGAATVFGPGEYEIKGIEISGWPINGKTHTDKKTTGKELRTVYAVAAEDLNLGFLGHMEEMPDPKILEELGQIDILFVPAGGAPFISQESAAKLIKQISPKMVVASFFKIPGLKSKVDDAKAFFEELDQKAEPEEKLVIKKKDLAQAMKAVLLKI